MANLRQLSVLSLTLSLLAGSVFSLNSKAEPAESEDPPPKNRIFFESDLWQQDANKEWVFTRLLLSAIRSPNEAKIGRLQVTEDTRQSLKDIRFAFLNPDTQSQVQTASIPDLVYAYSWSNAGFISHLFSGLNAIKNRLVDLDSYAGEKIGFYDNNRAAVLGTMVAVGGAGGGIYGLRKLCAPPAVNPAEGNFIVKHFKDTGTNIVSGITSIGAAIQAHPYIAGAFAATYAAYELCLTAGNMYYDVPVSLRYYTDRIIHGDGTAQAATWTNTFYRFSEQRAEDHYHGYIDMSLYHSMLYDFLLFDKRINQLQFGAIPPHPQQLLKLTSQATALPEMVHTPYLPDYFDRIGSDYNHNRTIHRTKVKEAVDKVVNLSSPDIDCRKFILFNYPEADSNPFPLYLFSLCSVGDTFAYAKLPRLPHARIRKAEVAEFVQDLMEYTGSTRLVIMSAGSK